MGSLDRESCTVHLISVPDQPGRKHMYHYIIKLNVLIYVYCDSTTYSTGFYRCHLDTTCCPNISPHNYCLSPTGPAKVFTAHSSKNCKVNCSLSILWNCYHIFRICLCITCKLFCWMFQLNNHIHITIVFVCRLRRRIWNALAF